MPGTERNWADLDTPGAFDHCVLASIDELYAFAGLLCGGDRDGAERLVTGVYESLRRAVAEGLATAVSLGALRSAVRRRWIDDRRIGLLAQVDEACRDDRPAATLAELRELERVVLVLRHVNGMPGERIADELGVPVGRVGQIEASARRRLHGDRDPVRRWIRQYYGDAVHVRPDLVDAVVGRAHAEPDDPPVSEPDHGTDGGPPTMSVPVHRPVGDHDVGTGEPDEPIASATATDAADAADTSEAPATGRRRWVAAVIGIVLVGALVATLAMWRSSRDDDTDAATSTPSTAVRATTVPGGTAVPSTLSSTLSGTPAAGSSVVGGSVPAGAFEPACVERPAAPGNAPVIDEVALDLFGPLGTAPNLVIDLPDSVTGAGVADAAASVLRVPGGVVVTVRSNDLAPFDGSIVARVDLDGAVRWLRCFPGTAFVRSQSGAPLADTAAINIATAGPAWQELSLADGSLGVELAEPPVPVPLTRGEQAPWPDPAIATLPGEGFTAGATNGVTIVLGCLVLNVDGVGCDHVVLRGYSTADNSLFWSRDGVTDVAIVKNGYAVIRYGVSAESAAWYMINAADGTAVAGQVWADPATFASACCGGGAQSWVEVAGGVVAASASGSVAIWYPAVAGLGGASASLP